MPGPNPVYRGRFAPSPTGPLHLGSLIAALASFLDARHAHGHWLLRMEDIDPPREQAGAADAILHSLQAHGLYADEPVLWQSQRLQAYRDALAQLAQQQQLFRCRCSRQQLGPSGACCGACRQQQASITAPYALRVQVARDFELNYQDRWQGSRHWALGQQLTDFVVWRKDGLVAYQLAVVVDDAAQGISHVVRGSDLLDSTPRQRYLQQLLAYHQPRYSHIPVLTDPAGHKLSKQNHAPAVDDQQPAGNLRRALQFLQQPPPPPHLHGVSQILSHAISHWSPQRIPRQAHLPEG